MNPAEHHPLCEKRIAFLSKRKTNPSDLYNRTFEAERERLSKGALSRIPEIAELQLNRLKMMVFYWSAFSGFDTEEKQLALTASYGALLLQEGSDKLKKTFSSKGKKFREFSLVAALNCPGAGLCKKFCYTEVGHSIDPRTWARRAGNWYASKRSDFVERVVSQIKWEKPDVVRIHVAGDFYDEVYINKWMEIIDRVGTGTRFYAYTKSVVQMKRVEKERGGFPSNFGVVYSWGAKQKQWEAVEPLKGDRMSVIVAGPGPGGYGVIRDHAKAVMVPALIESMKKYDLRSIGTGAPLYDNSTESDWSAAYGKEQIIVLHWHGGSDEEVEGIGRENDHEHSMPLTLQRWDGKAWTAPDTRTPKSVYKRGE